MSMMTTNQTAITKKSPVKFLPLIVLVVLLASSFYGSNVSVRSSEGAIEYVKDVEDKITTSKSNSNIEHTTAVVSKTVPSYTPYCKSFTNQDVQAAYAKFIPDGTSFVSDINKNDTERIQAGDFPKTRFTSHVQSILELMDLDQMASKCWKFFFTVDQTFSTPTSIFCSGMPRTRIVPWWCKIFHQLFETNHHHAFPPILPTNVTLAISSADFNDGSKEGYACIGNSSPGGNFTITNFLELQRMADRTSYPILNWTQRCQTPIWRGSAWKEQGGTSVRNESLVLERVLSKSPRLRAVLFSKEHPDLLDARISDPKNGFMSPLLPKQKKLWKRNATNGLHKLLPIHAIPPREYYAQYQTAVVLCGLGAAFRTPIHMSTATAVILQKCPYEEWYHSYMVPWQHYIPLDQELQNLSQTMQWVRDHPDQVYEIAKRGRQFYEDYLSFERNYDHFYELVYRLALLSSSKKGSE